MKKSIRQTLVMSAMLVAIGTTATATKLNVKDVDITFPDGYVLKVSTNKRDIQQIIKENNVVVLEDEEASSSMDGGKLNIKITKKKTEAVNISDINLIANKLNKNEVLEEKLLVENIEIPFKKITKKVDNSDENGKSVIYKKVVVGIKEVTYRVKYDGDKIIEKKEISSKVIKEPVDKVVKVTPKVTSRSGTSRRYGSKWSYTDAELDKICAITAQECSSSYEGALAVITTACNRAESSKWKSHGRDPLTQYMAPYQFTITYRKRLNGNYKSYVKQAVIDALNGKRNHSFLSFRSASTGRAGTNIGGNVYFNHM